MKYYIISKILNMLGVFSQSHVIQRQVTFFKVIKINIFRQIYEFGCYILKSVIYIVKYDIFQSYV